MSKKRPSRSGIDRTLKTSEQVLHNVVRFVVYLATLPYYRVFQFNTLKPILQIAACTTQPTKSRRLRYLIDRWRTRKLTELHFISIACAILAAAVIGSFSWTTVPDAYWLAPAFWYCSLVFAILGILLSAQQTAVLDLLGPPRIHSYSESRLAQSDVRRYLPLLLTELRTPGFEAESQGDRPGVGLWKPRWKMVFTWQCPMMFMSYSVTLFLLGLTMFVCTPLIQRAQWSTDSDIAVIYLALSAIAGGVFVFCSFWVYHYVDLEQDVGDLTEMDSEVPLR